MKYFKIFILVSLIGITMFFLKKDLKNQEREKYLRSIDNRRLYDSSCNEKTKFYYGKHTNSCEIENNFSPTGDKWNDDCGRLIWAYSTIRCGEYRYFGWQSWNNSEDPKNVWIKGNQYYRSCQWPKGVSDEDLKSEDCKYDFLEAQ